MHLIDREYVPISEYYLLEAHKACKAQLTASVRAAANSFKNLALRGWLEHLDVIEHVINTNPKILLSGDCGLVLLSDAADGIKVVSTSPSTT